MWLNTFSFLWIWIQLLYILAAFSKNIISKLNLSPTLLEVLITHCNLDQIEQGSTELQAVKHLTPNC